MKENSLTQAIIVGWERGPTQAQVLLFELSVLNFFVARKEPRVIKHLRSNYLGTVCSAFMLIYT